MGRVARDNRERFTPKPVEKIEVSNNKPKLRLALAVILGLFGLGMIMFALYSHLTVDAGWTEIKVSSSSGISCGNEFVFQYYLGGSEMAPTAEKKLLTNYYSEICVKAYQLFNSDTGYEDVKNIHYINEHPNEDIEVEPALYEALKTFAEYDCRLIFLAPVYEQYQTLFFCADDSETGAYDPFQNSELAEWFKEVGAFASDQNSIRLEFPKENTVRLVMSDELLAYSEKNEIAKWLDLFWMKNAVTIDYLADALSEKGYIHGCLSSYDGYVRNMDDSGMKYEYALYSREDNIVSNISVMQYKRPLSLVAFKDYPSNSLDGQRYYEYENGEIRFPYISLQDGLCKSAEHNMVVLSREDNCTELAVKTAAIYIADTWSVMSFEQPEFDEVDILYTRDGVLHIIHESCNVTFQLVK